MDEKNEKDCPICMDVVLANYNHTTTECGHCFHTSCLMRNTSVNGYGCPYCRTAMFVVPPNTGDEDEDDDEADEDDEDDEADEADEADELRSFRLFFDRIFREKESEEGDCRICGFFSDEYGRYGTTIKGITCNTCWMTLPDDWDDSEPDINSYWICPPQYRGEYQLFDETDIEYWRRSQTLNNSN